MAYQDAYTYAYATLGELFAWIIGWDLDFSKVRLPGGVIAADWTKYFNEFLEVVTFAATFAFPSIVDRPPGALVTATRIHWAYSWLQRACSGHHGRILAMLLIVGIKESATTNAVLVAVKVGVVLFVIGVGIRYVHKSNWTSIPVEDRLTTDMGESLFAGIRTSPMPIDRAIPSIASFLDELAKHRDGQTSHRR